VNIRPGRVVLLAITHDRKDYEMSARSESATTAAHRNGSLVVRSAEPADHEAIGGVVLGAYARYAGQLVPEVFSRCLDDALDLGTHASYGRLLVAGAPVLAIRTASIMTEAIAGYERLGYRRSPEFDGAEPVNSVAHLRYVAQMYMNLAR